MGLEEWQEKVQTGTEFMSIGVRRVTKNDRNRTGFGALISHNIWSLSVISIMKQLKLDEETENDPV